MSCCLDDIDSDDESSFFFTFDVCLCHVCNKKEHQSDLAYRFVCFLIIALLMTLIASLCLAESKLTHSANSIVHSSSFAKPSFDDQGGQWDYCFHVTSLNKWCCLSGDKGPLAEGSQFTMTITGLAQQCSLTDTQQRKETFAIVGYVFVPIACVFYVVSFIPLTMCCLSC